jgi:peptidoglycan/LPS O-acetylase OafA/YrhL
MSATASRRDDPALSPGHRDDRVLPATHWAALVVFIILVPAVVVLWGTPSHTHTRWAWTIKPDLTPIFLGAGYGAGTYFFWRTFRARAWHPSSAGVLAASVFAGLMLAATLIHYDRFNHGHAPFLGATAFWGWLIVYIISPFIVFALWWRNRATDPREPAPGDPVLPSGVLLAARAMGVVAVIVAAVFFLSPSTAIHAWSWKLTPLTARVLASFTAQVGVGALVLSLDRRWSAWRLIVESFFVATALLLVGAIRAWHAFTAHDAKTYLYIAGLIAADVALLTLYVTNERRARRPILR